MKTDYVSYFERLEYLKELIEKGAVISPKQLSEKFKCCDKTARNMINKLRDRGFKIEYCKSKKILHKKLATVFILPSNIIFLYYNL